MKTETSGKSVASQSASVVWKLKSGMDRRFRAGHPWVYSNELAESPKGLVPGGEVELQDISGRFLARGYGNPASLIAFRVISRDAGEKDALSIEGFERRLEDSLEVRERLGLHKVSFRWVFGEADGLPGLVVDRYVLARAPGDSASAAVSQVLVVQAHTAGMDRRIREITAALEIVVRRRLHPETPWETTFVISRRDVGVRRLEGLEAEGEEILHDVPGARLNEARIQVGSLDFAGTDTGVFHVDLREGQKTGFFLDQSANIAAAARWVRTWAASFPSGRARRVRILDLCCYVGQWSSRFTSVLRSEGFEVEVVPFDASARALEFAVRNISGRGARVEARRGDVLRDLAEIGAREFDIVICDPPALVKGRKDVGPGTHAYLQLNTQALRLVAEGGIIVSCSCSALLEEAEFVRVLAKAASRNQRTVRWIGRGTQGPDHPVRAEFPEGQYLKAMIGFVGN